jgi:beta-lactamase regulating signal transducer with metallopeptidase domain
MKANIQSELARRHRSATIVVWFFFALNIVLVAIAYLARERIFRPANPQLAFGLWLVILVCGLGVFVLRRTRFSAMRLRDIAAVKGVSAMLRTLQGTTIQVASIGGAIGLLGFIITIMTGDWSNMLRAAGVSIIVLLYCYPFKSAWQRTVQQLAPPE